MVTVAAGQLRTLRFDNPEGAADELQLLRHVAAQRKMVRYSGFLANRKRGTLLPRVYQALQMQAREKPEKPGFALLMKGFLGTDPGTVAKIW